MRNSTVIPATRPAAAEPAIKPPPNPGPELQDWEAKAQIAKEARLMGKKLSEARKRRVAPPHRLQHR